ncbi:phosphatase PAP2 family protein [Massilia oculi]|uniref:Phosphatase PAP2 family protein n=1 Tax=Massilia hydrophila TaxID=3044279 RepID=A0ABS7Y8P3_9BURK|nr:phosphatase PAP2 family protein [Massilia oculi]MCA1854914.1 phosphatase PAP2 family protein [Massilia oculi]
MPAFATDSLPAAQAEADAPAGVHPEREAVPRRLLGAAACGWSAAALALAALGILALGYWTDADLLLADLLYDRASASFPWREAWLTLSFGHTFLKAVLTALAVLFIGAALADALWPQAPLDRHYARLRLRVIAWAAVLVPLVTSLLKQTSNAYCPWDLARYGGAAPHLRLFASLPPGVLPGHCLPAGHASSALWLVSLVVLWLPGPPRRALRALGLCLLPGLALGWMQQMRGAHFLSHTLWSAWIACAIVAALVALLQGGEARPASGGISRRFQAGIRCRAR